ncbi:MAG TPA: glycosyltransferase family 4 protein [Thermoleophilaceae bacterium]
MRPEVAIAYRSGLPPARAWSGIPAGLARGLAELDIDSRLIDAEPRRPVALVAKAWAAVVRGDRNEGLLAPEIFKMREVQARLRARKLTAVACVQMGSDFGEPVRVPRVILQDMTVTQAHRLMGPEGHLARAATWVEWERACYRNARACCVASRWTADSLMRDYGLDPAKVHVVGFGRNFDPTPVPRDWDTPRFLFTGLDWNRKNGPMLLRAFARVRDEFPEATLDLVGDTPRADLPGVTAHGRLDRDDPEGRRRMERLLETATCFVMPSKYEPFGMVYVEAGAAGIPSIGTTVGGSGEAIGDGGLVVDPKDEGALVDAMCRLSDPQRAAALGAAALRRSRLFTWRAVAERVVRALGIPDMSARGLEAFL